VDGGESALTSTHHEVHMGFMDKGVVLGVDSLGPIFGERSQVPVLRWVELCIF